MGVYNPYKPGASPLAQQRQRYEQPTYSAGTQAGKPVGFSETGFPEAIQADQLLEQQGGVIGLIDTAARTPAYVYERPLAAIDTLISSVFGISPEAQERGTKGVLDTVVEAVREVPVVGKPLSDIGGLTDDMFRWTQSTLTSGDAWLVKNIWDRPPGSRWNPDPFYFDPEYLAASWNSPVLNGPGLSGWDVDKEKEQLRKKGWTDADFLALKNGEKSVWDFPEKRVASREGVVGDWADFLGKMALDPTNIVFGAGLLSKTGRFIDWGARLAKASAAANKGVKATGVTSTGFAEAMVNSALRRGDNVLRAYRNKVAIPTTVAQVSLNAVSDAFPEVKNIPLLGEVFDIAEKIGDNKPLSQNDLFMVASMLNFPARSIAREGYKRATQPLKRKAGVQLEREALDVLAPEVKGYGSQKLARAMEVLGIETEGDWQDFLTHVIRTTLNAKNPLLSIAQTPTFKNFLGKNIADLGFYAKEMQRRTEYLLRREFEDATLKPADIRRTMHAMVEGRGGSVARQMAEERVLPNGKKVPGPAIEAQRFTPEKLGRTWQAWLPIAKAMSEAFGGKGSPLVPAIADNFLASETIDWMQFMLRDLKRSHGSNMVPADLVEEILMDQPVVFRYTRQNSEIQRVLGKSTNKVDVDLIDGALGDARKHAFNMSEWTADVTEWQNSFVRSTERVESANSVIDQNQALRDEVSPEFGGTEVVIQDASYVGPRRGAPAHTEQMRAQRNEPDVAIAEHNVPLALREAGVSIDSAVQIGVIDGNVANSAVSLRLPAGIDAGEVEMAGVLFADAVQAPVFFAITRGADDMARLGMTPNAIEFIWKPERRLTAQELDDIAIIVRQRFGKQARINDTTGVVSVVLDSEPANLERGLELVTQKLRVEPTRGRVHFQRYRRRVGQNDTTSISFSDARTTAGRDQRYWVAKARISDRLDGPQLGGTEGLAGGGRGGPDGPTGQPPGRGGSGAYRTGEGAPLTRWESSRGNSPRGSEPEFALQSTPESLGEFRGRAAAALGSPVRIESGSRLFQLPDGAAGAWVTPGGELRVWRKPRPGRSIDDELNRLIAEASEHAVVIRVEHRVVRFGGRNSTGSSVDIYGAHGWRVVGTAPGTNGDVVYLLRDVAGDSAFPEIPPRAHGSGGFQQLKERGQVHRYRSNQQANAMAHGNANRLYPDGVVERMPAVEREAMNYVNGHTLEEVEDLLMQDPTNLSLLRARDVLSKRAKATTSTGGATYKPAEDVEPVLKLSTKDAEFGESGVVDAESVADWDNIAVGLPKEGIPGNITRGHPIPEGDGWDKVRYVHYDEAGLPDAAFTFKVATKDGVRVPSSEFPSGVDSSHTAFNTHVIVRPDARGKGLATRLYDQAAGDGYNVTAAPRSFSESGRVFFDKYMNAGPWYYHGTFRHAANEPGSGIIEFGVRPGNPNGNWTTNIDHARRFSGGTIKVKNKDGVFEPITGTDQTHHPIFRTRRPGGRAVNDEVVAGGRVMPEDMQVSWDDGWTWEDVGALKAREVTRRESLEASAKAYQDLRENYYRGDGDLMDMLSEQLNDMDANINMGEPVYRSGAIVLQRNAKGAASPGTKFLSGSRTEAELLELIEKGSIMEYPPLSGEYYWTSPDEGAFFLFQPDGTPVAKVTYRFKGWDTPKDSHGALLVAERENELVSLQIHTYEGQFFDRAMASDVLREARERVGLQQMLKMRNSDEFKEYIGALAEGLADDPDTYTMVLDSLEESSLDLYSSSGSSTLNHHLRRGRTPRDIENDPSTPYTEEIIEAIDRATHKGVYPDGILFHADNAPYGPGEFITWRGVGEERYGSFSQDYVDQLLDLQPGDHIMDEAPWSTTSSEHVADREYFQVGKKAVKFIIHNKPGQRMAWMHHTSNEAEILAPRRTIYHVLDKKIEYNHPKGAPTKAMDLEMHSATAQSLAEELQHAKQRAITNHGYIDDEVEKNIDLLMDALTSENPHPTNADLVVIRIEGQGPLNEFYDIAQSTSTVMTTEARHGADLSIAGQYAKTPDWTMQTYLDELRHLQDVWRQQWVPDEGMRILIELENMGDDWIDPQLLRQAVTDTIDNGGGTFDAVTMQPYDPKDVGGIAVATYRDAKTGNTTFRRLEGNDMRDPEKVKRAIEETREAFPDSEYVGTWFEMTPAGDAVLHIGPTKVFPRTQLEEAFALARKHQQLTVFDYDVMTTYPTPNSYNMAKGRAWVRRSKKPRTPAQNARDYSRKRAQALKNKGKVVRRIDQNALKHEDTTLYLDDNGQTGVAVAPDGEIIDFFSVNDTRTRSAQAGATTDLLIEDAPVPLIEVGREVIKDGKATHAVVPDYAVASALDLGLVPVAETPEGLVMVMENKLLEPVENVVKLPTREEGLHWAYNSMGKEPPPPYWAPRIEEEMAGWDGGLIRYLYDQEQEIAAFHPRLDPSFADEIELLTPAQAAKVYAAEAELRRYKTGYTLSKMPEGGSPYWEGMGKDVDLLHGHGRTLEQTWFEKVTGPVASAFDRLWAPVYSRELSRLQSQHIYDEMLQYGATVGDVNSLNRALKKQWERMPQGPGGTKLFRRVDSMTPNTIRSTAADHLPEAVQDAIIRAGDDIVDILQRSGSRTYRYLSEKFPVVEGQGKLGGLIDTLYGKGDSKVWGLTTAALRGRRGLYALKTGYHIFRFLADPRWIAMNWYEADILALARGGWRGRARGRSAKMTNAQRAHAATVEDIGMMDIEDILTWDAGASGWLDPRNLNGHIGKVFDVERKDLTKQAIIERIRNGDPVIDDLESLFGKMDDNLWVDEIDRMLYDIDTKGARATVLDEAAANGMAYGQNALFDEFLENLWKQHSDNFRDIMHIFHGNVNRNNLERLLNSPLLWWPLSYQLKAGKWVFDLLTNRFAGAQTDLLGAGYLSYAMERHYQLMESNDTYQGIFMDHPVLWRALSMALPMTPFDVGVFMARWTRYTGSWAGNQLGLWEPHPGYPETLPEFFQRSTKLGPLFSLDLTEDLINELNYK